MVKVIQMEDDKAWDDYVAQHDRSNAYHSSHWQKIVTHTYGCKSYALAAMGNDRPSNEKGPVADVKGILPLVHLKSPLFGNRLVSMPYVDHGGIVADSPDCEDSLIQAALDLGKRLGAQHIELRHLDKIVSLEDGCSPGAANSESNPMAENDTLYPKCSLRTHKMRLLLPLPNSSEALMKSFKSKLRSQINRPVKAGLNVKIGGLELLDDFYTVFCINMRDLGSPVHSKTLLTRVMAKFQNSAKAVLVYKAAQPVAAGLILGFKDVMINPWASSLRQHSKESPNMMLYWRMMAYAADHGYSYFDFGRSTPDEGTYRFKMQWGAQPHPMYWYTLWLDHPANSIETQNRTTESKKKALAIKLWQKLPVPLSRLIGPHIRKQIDL